MKKVADDWHEEAVDPYNEDAVLELLDDDEMSAEEAAFMVGYMESA